MTEGHLFPQWVRDGVGAAFDRTFPPAICDVCEDGYHEACDGSTWCGLINFPTACECGSAIHEGDQP